MSSLNSTSSDHWLQDLSIIARSSQVPSSGLILAHKDTRREGKTVPSDSSAINVCNILVIVGTLQAEIVRPSITSG